MRKVKKVVVAEKSVAGRPHRFSGTLHPLVYEVNTRLLLNELSAQSGKRITLATVPDHVLDEWADLHFDAVWLMGVWTTGAIGLEMARTHPGMLDEYRRALPDFSANDIFSSPYAVKAYTVSPALGGNKGLLGLRKRLEKRGIGLFLDFVCNHTARDHAWVKKNPEFFVRVDARAASEQPDMFFIPPSAKKIGIAFGRDPYFPGWTDTAQLNFKHRGMRFALIGELVAITDLCDGVRCDMAMLALEEVFDKTWQHLTNDNTLEMARGEFWSEAIDAVRSKRPECIFIAEAYWNLEWQLQQLGFDYTYDKTLYDRLLKEGASAVYDHLKADQEYQRHSLRFIENHDEHRAAQILSSEAWHCAAATTMATVPGMVLFHEGQLDGRRTKLPVQLGRRPAEPVVPQVRKFYEKLLSAISHSAIQRGSWTLLTIRPAWQENQSWNSFLAHWWQREANQAVLVIINYAPLSGQCYVELNLDLMEGSTLEFRDTMGPAMYVRERSLIHAKGMFFDLPPYGLHVFEVRPIRK